MFNSQLKMVRVRDMIKLYLMIFVFLCCIACNKEQVSEPDPQTSYELWRSQNLHDYSIDQSRMCFCINAGELVRITVRSDTIYGVIKISDTSIVTYPIYFTVDSLFGIIRNSKADSLVTRYNTQYGYPEFLDIDPQLHPVDGGVLYKTSNLQIL